MKNRLLYTLALLFAILQSFAQTYTYDTNYRLTEVKYGNGITVKYTYDALGNRLTKKVTGATAETFTITTAVSPAGSGSVSGGGTYSSGASVELHAIANAGYEFSKWSDGETANPRSVKVTATETFTAIFKETAVTPLLAGDLNDDGKVNQYDLNLLVDAYLSNANATNVTDLDADDSFSIADIAKLIGIINDSNSPMNSNGHPYVDLGLPSGALWATCNVGALAEEEIGEFYAWGELETKESYSWANYKWCDGEKCNVSNPTLTKYCDRGGYGLMDGKVSLELEDDVAHVKWGGDWHIPTQAEFQELIDNCTVEWIKIANKQHAFRFTGANGNSILMPASGEWSNANFYSDDFNYWSADLASNRSNNTWTISSSSGNAEFSGAGRYKGFAVRPVLSAYKPKVHQINAPSSHNGRELVDLGLPSGALWSTYNLGASSPEGYGCYYSWGETNGSCEGKSAFGMDYYPVDVTEQIEPGEHLDRDHDAVSKKWGGEWRMPTLSELKELINKNYTTCEWTSVNGVNGYRITSIVRGFEGKSIFLPAAGKYDGKYLRYVGEKGDYWSSTLYGDHDVANNVGYVYFDSSHISWWEEVPYYGLPIRPVVGLDDLNK